MQNVKDLRRILRRNLSTENSQYWGSDAEPDAENSQYWGSDAEPDAEINFPK